MKTKRWIATLLTTSQGPLPSLPWAARKTVAVPAPRPETNHPKIEAQA